MEVPQYWEQPLIVGCSGTHGPIPPGIVATATDGQCRAQPCHLMRALLLSAMVLAGAAWPLHGAAQEWSPTKPVRIIVPVVGAVRSATYTISWRTAGEDGHAMKGSYVFRVKP